MKRLQIAITMTLTDEGRLGPEGAPLIEAAFMRTIDQTYSMRATHQFYENVVTEVQSILRDSLVIILGPESVL